MAIPVEPEGLEIGELCLLHTGTYSRAVEVLHTYQKSRPGRTREQPCQEGCSKVSEMERAVGLGAKRPSETLFAAPSLLPGRERLVAGDYRIQTRTVDSVREARMTLPTPRRQSSRVMTEASDILRPGSTPVIRTVVLAPCGLCQELSERAWRMLKRLCSVPGRCR